MSVARTQLKRSNRAALSLPYARPLKKSSWSLSSFLSYLNPLRSQSEEEDVDIEGLSEEEDYEEEDGDHRMDISDHPPPPAQNLSKRGLQLERTLINAPSTPPRRQHAPVAGTSSAPHPGLPSVPFTFTVSTSPAQNLEAVSQYLTSHVNKPISEREVQSLVSLIQQSKPVEANLFRFETGPSTSPPHGTSVPPRRRTIQESRKLNKNPNGPYTWKGAGSSRARSINRFSAPAFRTARRPASEPAPKTTSVDSVTGDAKRRRIEEPSPPQQSTSGTTQNSITSSPATSRTGTLSTPSKSTTSGTPPARLRTPGLGKPTTPAHPSPLRQAWSESTSPSEKQAQTQTAKHVSQLVSSFMSQDAKVLDIRNPYEAALPVKMSKRKRVPPVRKTVKTATKKDDKTESKIKEMPAHAIIEATLPAGSKRSRPPPNLEKSPQLEQPKSRNPPNVVVEEIDDEDGPSATKKAKPLTNGHGLLAPNPSYKAPSTETPPATAAKEVKEKPVITKLAPISVPPLGVSSKSYGPKSSIPKEPSKLRYSMQADSPSAPSSPGSVVDEPEPASKSPSLPVVNFKSTSPVSAPAPAPAPAPGPAPAPVKEKPFTFSSIPTTEKEKGSIFFTPSDLFVKEKTVSFATLPEKTDPAPVKEKPFTFSSIPTEKSSIFSTPTTLPVLFSAPLVKKDPTPFSFDTSVPTTGKKDSFSLGYPEPRSESTGKKDSPASHSLAYPDPEPAPAPTKNAAAFSNFSSTPVSSSGSKDPKMEVKAMSISSLPTFIFHSTTLQASYSLAMVDARIKPSSLLPSYDFSMKVTNGTSGFGASKSTRAGFDWSAAGTKPFTSSTTSSDGEWTCNTCMLKNPGSAKEKCTVCEADRPRAAPAKATSGFNWGAAGMKPPSSDSEWTCNSCMLKNPASAKDKCTICEADRS